MVIKSTEQKLRHDAMKWDTVRHAEHGFLAQSLDQPVFDIHHVARQPGNKDTPSQARRLGYALVVTVKAERHRDLYDQVLASHPVLEVIRPRAPIPVRVKL
jgi:hypothetical protein